MIKAIFLLEKLTKNKIEIAQNLGANAIFTGSNNLSSESVSYIKKNDIKLYSEISIFQGKYWWKKFPDCVPVDRNGNKMKQTSWYAGVCPNSPEVRKKLLTSINRLIEVYLIDGIWLDFIRYPCYWEKVRNADTTEYCFCKICLEKFKRDGGKEPKGKEWTEWKCKQITDFAAEIKRLIALNCMDKSRPVPKLGMFAVPWQYNEYNSAIKQIIGQNFVELSKHVDIFSPMVYHKFCDRSILWIKKSIDYFSEITHKPILPIIQTEDRAGKISRREFLLEIEAAEKKPAAGAIVFFLEDLLKDFDKVDILKTHNHV